MEQPAVLSVLAHPDDAEFLCAGTMIRLCREHGFAAHLATMTAGDCGSTEMGPEEISRVRRAEGARAADLIGGQYYCLEERDLLVTYCERTLEKVTRLLRRVRPNLVFTHSPADYMLDHEMTSTVVRAAVFAAPIPNFLADRDLGPPLPHIPHLYYCDPVEGKDLFGANIPPRFYVDISAQIELKVAMMACHASQREWLLKHHGLDSYLQSLRDWSAQRGRECGVPFAEGFRQHLGHSYPQDNRVADLLSGRFPL